MAREYDNAFGVGWLWSCLGDHLSLAMVFDGPVLALSDIMHGMAPSPTTSAPQEDDTGAENATPEPLDYAQIEVMRKRVLEFIVSGASKMSTSSREKELIEMV